MINVISSSRYKINRQKIKKLVNDYLLAKNVPLGYSINIVFVGKNKMRQLALNYKQENEALPVLSFPYNEKQDDDILIGEVFVCYPQAVLLAAQRNKKVDETITSLITHGIDNLLK